MFSENNFYVYYAIYCGIGMVIIKKGFDQQVYF